MEARFLGACPLISASLSWREPSKRLPSHFVHVAQFTPIAFYHLVVAVAKQLDSNWDELKVAQEAVKDCIRWLLANDMRTRINQCRPDNDLLTRLADLRGKHCFPLRANDNENCMYLDEYAINWLLECALMQAISSDCL